VGGRLHAIEVLGMLGGAVLAVSVFLPWYATDPGNRLATIDGSRGAQSCWEVHPILRWLMLAAALAPFVVAYVVVTGRQLSWARGQMTAMTSIAAMGLIFFNGAIDRPGTPSSAISLRYGWLLAVMGAMLMFSSAARRSSSRQRARKPSGTI
jgi:hypothetical protein